MNQSFKDKVRSMTGKEIVMAMVNGLQHAYYALDMGTYGEARKGICYGCAATHCITEIAGIKFMPENIESCHGRSLTIGVDFEFLNDFELAIDHLRKGQIRLYNQKATEISITRLPIPAKGLTPLLTEGWQNYIQEYIDYANTLSYER